MTGTVKNGAAIFLLVIIGTLVVAALVSAFRSRYRERKAGPATSRQPAVEATLASYTSQEARGLFLRAALSVSTNDWLQVSDADLLRLRQLPHGKGVVMEWISGQHQPLAPGAMVTLVVIKVLVLSDVSQVQAGQIVQHTVRVRVAQDGSIPQVYSSQTGNIVSNLHRISLLLPDELARLALLLASRQG